MGRAKVKMEFITKDKPRHLTFKKRKEGLIRKLHEFSTLCAVKACMIISGGGPNPNIAPEAWPEDPEKVNDVINFFKTCKSKGTSRKDYSLHDFFEDREKKIVEDLAKLRRKNLDAKFPTRPDLLEGVTEPQLREFHTILSSKAQQVKSRIQLLRRLENMNIATTHPSGSGFYSPLLEVIENKPHISIPSNGVSFIPHTGNNSVSLNMNLVDDKYNVHRGELMPPSVNHNSMSMMLMMNGNEQVSANIQLNRQVFLGAAMDPMIPPPMQPWYYPAPPHAQQYMLPPPPPPPGPPQPYTQLRHFSNPDQHDDFIQYRMRNG